MDAAAFKAWREARKISQADLATALGWTRDRVASRELGRVPLPDDIQDLLAAAAAKLSPPLGINEQDAGPYGSRCLTMDCQPIELAAAAKLPLNTYFWKHAGRNPATRNTVYSLFCVRKSKKGNYRVPLCTFVQLDTREWRAFEIAGDRTPEAVANLNQWLDAQQQHLSTIPFLPLAPDPDKTP